jgi:hypothetical protein
MKIKKRYLLPTILFFMSTYIESFVKKGALSEKYAKKNLGFM